MPMRTARAFILILVGTLAIVTASAQDQRKVTPVTPNTNKVLTPDRNLDEKIIEQYLAGDTVSARAEARKDSLRRVYPHYPTLTEVSFGLNFADPLMALFGQKYGGVDISATLNMWNRIQPTVEIGLGKANDTPEDMNYTYHSPLAPYFKLGANYNFLFKNEPKYQAFAGFRVGFSSFKYDITDVTVSNPYWNETSTFDLKGEKSHALWGEFVIGLKVHIINNFSLGWTAKYHGIFNEKKNAQSKAWYIPGYGVRNRNYALGISLYYTIPLSLDRWPKSDN